MSVMRRRPAPQIISPWYEQMPKAMGRDDGGQALCTKIAYEICGAVYGQCGCEDRSDLPPCRSMYGAAERAIAAVRDAQRQGEEAAE